MPIPPVQKFEDELSQIVKSLRDDPERRASPGTESASAADTPWKREKRSPEIFEGDVALKELLSGLAADPTNQRVEPPPAPAKTSIFALTARRRIAVLAVGGALGFLWAGPADRQAGEEGAPLSQQETPGPNGVGEQAPNPSAAAEQAAAGAALYEDFLKWRQRQLPGK
jgi:hypothetical protein